jgi:cell division protein FtsI/penicillin-binding protein 2
MAFGYAMMATPVQLARATAAFANGGRLVEPRLIAGVVRGDGTPELDVRPLPTTSAISAPVARQTLRAMADVFARGTGRIARIETYNLFGKTGTAHKSDQGRQSDEKYSASFVGGGPYEAPRLVIAIAIDEPTKELGYHGGQVAATTAARVLEQSLHYLGVPHSPPLPEPPEYLRDSLHGYAKSFYEPKRNLTDHPSQDTTAAIEARQD